MRITVVEDQQDLQEELVYFLRKQGHQVEGAANAIELKQLLRRGPPDLLLLDIGLPGDEDGIQIASALRDRSDLHIVIMTARSGHEERIRGFEAGADTYLVKPVSFRELEAVVRRATVRQAANNDPAPRWQFRALQQCLVSPEGVEISLTYTERCLLASMLACSEQMASRRELVNALGGEYPSFDDRRIEVGISRLRKKIREAAGREAPLKAGRNAGYAFTEPCANLVL